MAKLLSLFDGSGGFPLAAAMCGIVPVMASEVEPYPIAVTRSRFPQMEHLGDVSKVNGAEIEPVDIISFGSPCQDLSVAGKRAGLKHEENGDDETTRSGLFMEAIRIIKEMREATNGIYPAFALWENVPGAFSSNKGEDFRVVLEEFVKVVEPTAEMPPMADRKWPYADVIVGDGWSIAYRTLDAQYWGVPQRRRRIYLVADFSGERAKEILFERDGLRGYSPKSGTQREEIAGAAEDSIGATDREGAVAIENHPNDSRVKIDETGKCQSLTGRMGTGGGNVPLVMEEHADNMTVSDKFGALDCMHDQKIAIEQREKTYIVRRLTPIECARLQGFPDWWGQIAYKEDFTDEEYAFWLDVRNTMAQINGKLVKEYTKEQILKWYNKLHTDSAEYKMWGNGIALPNALYVMEGIAEELE